MTTKQKQQNKGWEVRTLGEVCEILDNLRKPVTKKDRISGPYPYYGATGVKDHVEKYIFDEKLVLVGEDGAKWLSGDSTGYIVTGKCWVNNHAHVLRPKKDIMVHEWINYFLWISDLSEYVAGVTVPKLNQAKLKSITIPVPSISEQKRIVKILDEKFEVIDGLKKITEQQVVDAKELFESRLDGVYGGPSDDCEGKSLKEITTLLGDGLHGTPEYDENGDYFFINGNNLGNGEIIIKGNTKRVSQDEYEKHKKILNDRTVFVSINGTLGNVAFYNNEKVILGKSACYFNLVEGVNKYYVKYFIQSPVFIKYLHTEATGATIKNISLMTMREMVINLPILTQQISIVKELDQLSEKIKELEVIFRRKITYLEELKKSYLHEAFSGNL